MVSASHKIKRKKGTAESDEFIYLASHQLRNPVTRIRWVIELVLRTEKLTKQTKIYLILVQSSAARMNDLITMLLNVSRIEHGKMFFSPRSLDLVKFVKNFLDEYKFFSDEKGISITFKKHPLSLPVFIDSAAFYNIIQSIVSNAIEYTPKAGKIDISLEKRKDTFLIAVRDTGVGIPKEDQGHIFEKFNRGSNVQTIKRDGLGLGLYTANQTVRCLNGKVWFDSKKNKGTIFYVELPLIYTKP